MLPCILSILLSAHNLHSGRVSGLKGQGLCAGRLDVLLTADQPAGNYWISLTQQYRLGAPMGFAVLHYNGSAADTLPPTPNPQPTNITLFTAADINEVRTIPAFLPADGLAAWSQSHEDPVQIYGALYISQVLSMPLPSIC